MSETNQLALKLEVLRSVEVEGLPIEMGVLQDGTPFLSGRGLARACGISNSTLVEWGEFTPKLGDSLRAGKIAEILAAHGYENDRFFIRVPDEIYFKNEATISAYPDAVCMAFLEYYAIEVGKREALQNFRILGRSQLRSFIYKATGYNPDEHTVPDISMGKIWAKYWTDNGLAERYGNRVPHLHIYPEYFPQSLANGSIKAHIYPCAALGEVRQWLDFEYIPKKFPSYLRNKVKQGVISSNQVTGLLQAVKPLELPGDSKTA